MKKELSNTQNHSADDSVPQKSTNHTHSVELPLITDKKDVSIGRIPYTPTQNVVKNKNLLQGILYLIENTREGEMDKISIWSFKKACERHSVRCQELIDGYEEAYADPYVSQGRIEFRHIWKYIKENRENPTPHYLTNRLDKRKEEKPFDPEIARALTGY